MNATTPVPQNTSQWWANRHFDKLREKQTLGDVQLVFVGDSITQSWEDKGKDVWQEHYAQYNALNLGFAGDRTEHVLWRLKNGALSEISPKAIVLLIGTNNAGQSNYPAEDTARAIRAILDLLAEQQPQAKVLLLGIFPRGANSSDPARQLNEATNAIIQNYADNQHIFYLNINDQFLEENGMLSRSVAPDLLHLAPSQYKVWAEAMAPSLDKLMAK